jgi:hypothetical protein
MGVGATVVLPLKCDAVSHLRAIRPIANANDRSGLLGLWIAECGVDRGGLWAGIAAVEPNCGTVGSSAIGLLACCVAVKIAIWLRLPDRGDGDVEPRAVDALVDGG